MHVITENIPIMDCNKKFVVATLQFKMRLRNPVAEQISWFKQKKQLRMVKDDE